jgi:uncharacterized protein (TIGR02246 family)
MRPVSVWFCVAILAACQGSRAQEFANANKHAQPTATDAKAPRSATMPAEDAKAIAALNAAFTVAFNAGDARAAAATFTEDALVVDEHGQRTEGRENLKANLAALFVDSPRSTISIETQSLRLLGPDSAMEEGRTKITPAVGGPPQITRFTVVYVKRDGHWLQATVRDEHALDLTAHERLKELEWLVGDWINESPESVVHTRCKWTDDQNYLVREFTMKMRGESVLSGTQRIGWDPSRHQFKTWIFDSEGGFGEGYWTRDADRWVIKTEGVRQDGKVASMTNIVTRLGKHRASWQSIDRTLGGVAIPGADEFIIVRKPPDAGH